MDAISQDILTWISSRTADERNELFGFLAKDVLKDPTRPPFPIRDESNRTLGYLVRGETSEGWLTCLNVPETANEIKRRLANPGNDLTVEEFMVRARAAVSNSPNAECK